jgi:hypothetical protein
MILTKSYNFNQNLMILTKSYNFNQNLMILTVERSRHTININAFVSVNYHPEDGHMSGRNMLVVPM